MKKIIRITTIPASMNSLLKGQLKFMSNDFDVIAITSDGDCYDEMIKSQGVRGIKVEMTRQITPLKDLIALFQLIRIFIKEKPFIVHTHTPKAGTLGMWAAWICRVPNRIHTVAGLPLLEAKGLKRKVLDYVEKLTYFAATKVYPNSFKLQDIIVENNYTKSEKLKVIANGSSNGIDTSFFSKESCLNDSVNFNKYNELFDNNIFTFCFVGRVVKDKGINELVSAFIKLYEYNCNTRLIIVGLFEENLDPISLEVKRAIFNHAGIIYVGFQKDVRPFLLVSNAFVFPSYREGFPNVVMQAGAMGLASIVTDINGSNEIIIDGENGEIIPPKDENALFEKMKEWIENQDKVKSMAIKSRHLIENRYNQKLVWNALLEEYRKL